MPFRQCDSFFAADGGAFMLGDLPRLGSLGSNPPPNDIFSGERHTV